VEGGILRYFTGDRIKQAIKGLAEYRSDWVIIPLVFAVNGVNEDKFTDIQGADKPGTTTLLAKFFSGGLVGLPPVKKGNTLRPAFADVSTKYGDFVSHQSVNLWGSNYSSRGYREWVKEGLLESSKSSVFRVQPAFIKTLQENLKGFRFEDLLVWLFAFTGFPDEIKSWPELQKYFLDREIGKGSEFPKWARAVFHVKNGVPWEPADTLSERLSNADLQKTLIPSEYSPPGITDEGFSKRTHLPAASLTTLKRLVADKGQIVLYGPPGTGKTFIARELALLLTGGDYERVEVIQFHPSYSYEDFVIGLKPEVNEATGQLSYEATPGAFLTVAENAQGSDKPFVVIIDEINRGNLPRIFGELLYLLEYRKREGGSSDLGANGLSEASIPHREEPFSVPPNVIVIGTMNTSDRSIGNIDLALRRRFHFFPVQPDEAILRSYLTTNNAPAAELAVKLFRKVNARVRQEARLDADIIGQSFFMDPKLDEDLLRLRYEYSVLPLIEEIFYDRPEIVEKNFGYDTLITEIASEGGVESAENQMPSAT
jgi:hypothetical protein